MKTIPKPELIPPAVPITLADRWLTALYIRLSDYLPLAEEEYERGELTARDVERHILYSILERSSLEPHQEFYRSLRLKLDFLADEMRSHDCECEHCYYHRSREDNKFEVAKMIDPLISMIEVEAMRIFKIGLKQLRRAA